MSLARRAGPVRMTFTAEIQLDGRTATGIVVPQEVVRLREGRAQR
jgi:hypothetical protein